MQTDAGLARIGRKIDHWIGHGRQIIVIFVLAAQSRSRPRRQRQRRANTVTNSSSWCNN